MLHRTPPTREERADKLQKDLDALREAINITLAQADHINGVEYVAVDDLKKTLIQP